MALDSKNCPIGTYCDDIECKLTHPVERWVACGKYIECKNKECIYRHNRNCDKACFIVKDDRECKRNNCPFSHEEDIINWWKGWEKYKQEKIANGNHKKQNNPKDVCFYYQKGTCRAGNQCHFTHPEKQTHKKKESRVSVSAVAIPQAVIKPIKDEEDPLANIEWAEPQKDDENVTCITKKGTTIICKASKLSALMAQGII